jgi:capsular exopolysaccharide synthesis family protein
MSRIFDSIQRAQPRFPGIDLASLAEQRPEARLLSTATEERVISGDECATRELQIPESAPLIPFDGSHPGASEEYRILRTKIVQHQKQPKCIVVSSAGVGDGKSTTAINLASVFALKSDARILLMDGDFRRATVASQLGLPSEPGLADVLSGRSTLESAIVRAAQIPNLHVVPAGKASVNPSELLDSAAWTSLCLRCRRSYRYVFIDSPPIGTVADFDLIQAHCDGIILVARPDRTKRAHVLDILKNINKDKLVGVVLNSIVPWPLGKRKRSDSYYYVSAGTGKS